MAVVGGAVLAGVAPGAAWGDELVTHDNQAGSYVRYDGGTDSTMQACSTGRRTQNEPSVAVDPTNPNVVVAGANDYCAEITSGVGGTWVGYYRSVNGGQDWTDSLVPGYPADQSSAGLSSPVKGVCGVAGDPTQAFDGVGTLYYGFICFNRSKPGNGGIYVARYDDHGASYAGTTLIEPGTPSVFGLFQDKINLVVDQSNGNVYVAWARYSGANVSDVILFSRSTDGGQTFSRPARIANGPGELQFTDQAVGPDGAVYVTYRSYAKQNAQANAIWIVRSTDGGRSFGAPRLVSRIDPFDSTDYGPDTCGDGPFICDSGLTYARFSSQSAVAADDDGVHVVWSARNDAGQAKIFAKSSPDGDSWSGPAEQLDPVETGHQFFPDVTSAGGKLTAIFQDSRSDSAYDPELPPGNTASGQNSGDVLQAFTATSTDGGQSWSESLESAAGSNPNWEVRGLVRSPFFGDYNYAGGVGASSHVVWTDTRDLVPGTDPRGTAKPGGVDTFDGFQECAWDPDDINAVTYSAPTIDNPCLSQGALDQNIYAASGP